MGKGGFLFRLLGRGDSVEQTAELEDDVGVELPRGDCQETAQFFR